MRTRNPSQKLTLFGSDAYSIRNQCSHAGIVCTEEEGHVIAALGNSWSHSVNIRLILQYRDQDDERELIIAKAPQAPPACLVYRIEDKGIVMEVQDGNILHTEFTDPGMQRVRVRTSMSRGEHHVDTI